MKIHFDNIIYSLQRAGGISTYWSALIFRLLRDRYPVHFTESVHQNISRAELNIPKEQLELRHKQSVWLDRFRSLAFKAEKDPFIFHSSYNRISYHPKARQVVTIHDFVHEKFYKGARRYLHLHQKNKAIKSAHRIIAVSENTKKDLLAFHPYLSPDSIKVIYNGVSDDFFPLNLAPVAKPYLLFIGSRAYYKNFKFVIHLLSRMKEFELYIVGAALTAAETKLLQQQLPYRWKMFHNIDNQNLNIVYNQAYALIYPSAYEGFGIPLLEVMKTGTPFVALKSSSIPEVAGSAGVLVESLDVEAFEAAIYSIADKKDEMIASGLLQAGHFSWEKCYQETLNVYQELGL